LSLNSIFASLPPNSTPNPFKDDRADDIVLNESQPSWTDREPLSPSEHQDTTSKVTPITIPTKRAPMTRRDSIASGIELYGPLVGSYEVRFLHIFSFSISLSILIKGVNSIRQDVYDTI
jgi:hypothetical protein